MKTIAIILFTILSSISSLMGQIDNITWDYPLRPGVKAWEDIESYDDRLKALNIPESILKKNVNCQSSDSVFELPRIEANYDQK